MTILIVRLILINDLQRMWRIEMLPILVFLFSLSTYTLFQWVDIYSTRLALSKLSLEMHEVNSLLVFLTKKIGFDRATTVMWLIFAPLVGLIDAVYVFNALSFPTTCFLFGMFHVLAAANNFQIHFQTQIVGARNVERNTHLLIQMLKQQSFLEKIKLLIRLNFFKVFVAAYSLVSLLLFFQLLSSVVVTLKEAVSLFLLYLPPIMILALIMFFPVDAFGSFLISIRRLKLSKDNESNISDDDSGYVSLPVDVLEVALKKAKATNAEYVQFSISDRQESQK